MWAILWRWPLTALASAIILSSTMKQFRTNFGPRFSEGARLAWLGMQRRGWSQSVLQEKLHCTGGLVTRWLYGDRVPSVRWATEIERLLGVRVAKWAEPASVAFVLPAVAESARAEAAA